MHDDPDYGRILSDLRLKNLRLFPSVSHIFPIQTPILDRLGAVLLADALAPLQVGDGPGNLKDAGEGAGGEAEPVGDQFRIRLPAASSSQCFRRWRAFIWALQWIFVPLKRSTRKSRERSTRPAISAELSASLRSARSR